MKSGFFNESALFDDSRLFDALLGSLKDLFTSYCSCADLCQIQVLLSWGLRISGNIMSILDSDDLSRLGTNLGNLASTLAQDPRTVRAAHIRKAERSLVQLEEFASASIPQEAAHWLRAHEARQVLSHRVNQADSLLAEIAAQQTDVEALSKTLKIWNSLQDAERQKFLSNYQRAKQFEELNLAVAESHILHKYARYKSLNRLLPYADNAEHLCDAIFHFQNREKYEENIQKIELRRENAVARMASVKRGFNLALFLCVFVVTIPLCAPVALSLWNRRRDIETQLASMVEMRRREERRLQIADEGVIASEEINEILGDVPLETVRRTLEELRELRSEFQRAERNPSVTAALVAFVDLYRPRLKELFGNIPEETVDIFRWFRAEVDRLLNVEAEHALLTGKLESTQKRLKQLLRGHSESILRDSCARVEKICQDNFQVDLDTDYKADLARQMIKLPDVLRDCRVLLSHLSYGHGIDCLKWQDLYRWTLSMESSFHAMALELRLIRAVEQAKDQSPVTVNE